MNALCRVFDSEAALETDPDVAKLIIGMKKAAQWSIFPYIYFREADGSSVVLDRRYRLICRHRQNGTVEILPFVRTDVATSKHWIRLVSQHRLYTDFSHPADDEASRQRVLGVVERLGLKDEIIRRRQALRRERLDGWKRLRSRFGK